MANTGGSTAVEQGDPVAVLIDGLERFERVIVACERPDLSASTPDADSALRRLRSWDKDQSCGDRSLPPHLVAGIGLDIEARDVLAASCDLPPGVLDALGRFSDDLAALVQDGKATLQTPPDAEAYGQSLSEASKLAQRANRLRLHVAAALNEPLPSGRWYPAAWYSKASKGLLSPEQLRKAMIRGRLTRRKPRGRYQYELREVCETYLRFKGRLLAAAKAD